MADIPQGDGENQRAGRGQAVFQFVGADGPLPSTTIKADADGAACPFTIRRAQKALGVEAVKDGMKGGYSGKCRGRKRTGNR